VCGYLWTYTQSYDRDIYERFSIRNADNLPEMIDIVDGWLHDHPETVKTEIRQQGMRRRGDDRELYTYDVFADSTSLKED
jgi:hypothetical protein